MIYPPEKHYIVSHNLEELKWTFLCKHDSNNLTVDITPASPADYSLEIIMEHSILHSKQCMISSLFHNV